MKSKKISSSITVERLERKVQDLALDVQAIIKEHDLYVLPMDQAESWFMSLPIESLSESCEREHGLRKKFSLKDLRHKFKLRKLHDKTVDKFFVAKSKLEIAKIDILLDEIQKIEYLLKDPK